MINFIKYLQRNLVNIFLVPILSIPYLLIGRHALHLKNHLQTCMLINCSIMGYEIENMYNSRMKDENIFS